MVNKSRTRLRKRDTGDTLIEVIISIAVLGVIMAGAYSIVSRNYSGIRNAVVNTAARNEVNTQAQLIRYVFDRGNEETSAVRSKITSNGVLISATGFPKKYPPSVEDCKVNDPFFYLSLNEDYDPSSTDDTKKSPVIAKTVVGDQFEGAVNKKLLQSKSGSGDKEYSINTSSQAKQYPTPEGGGVIVQGYKYDGYIDYYVRSCWTEHGISSQDSGHLQSVVRVQYGSQT